MVLAERRRQAVGAVFFGAPSVHSACCRPLLRALKDLPPPTTTAACLKPVHATTLLRPPAPGATVRPPCAAPRMLWNLLRNGGQAGGRLWAGPRRMGERRPAAETGRGRRNRRRGPKRLLTGWVNFQPANGSVSERRVHRFSDGSRGRLRCGSRWQCSSPPWRRPPTACACYPDSRRA